MKYTMFFLVLFLSCSSNNQILTGKYEIKKSSKVRSFYDYIFNNCNIIGVELNLNKDSTFSVTTCSYKANGIWEVKNDNLILNYSNKYIYVDSLKGFKKDEKLTNKSECFLIKKNKLVQYNESVNFGSCKTELTHLK